MQLWSTSLCGHDNEELTFSLFKGRDQDQALPTTSADVVIDMDADKGTTGPRMINNAGNQPLLPGKKGVRDVFRLAMLLCSITELISGDLDGDEVDKLGNYINKYNRSQSQLLGPGWLTFNNHNVTHLPHFIRRFGSPWHFSSLPFERYNGLMGTIPTSGQKGGVLEASIAHNTAQRVQLCCLLAGSDMTFCNTRLLESVEGHCPSDLSTLDTQLKKQCMEDVTFMLLLNHLNRRASATTVPSSDTNTNPSASTIPSTMSPQAIDASSHRPHQPLCYTPSWDTLSLSHTACLNTCANFIRTAVIERGADVVKVGGVGQGGRDNQTNCWCLVSIDGVLQPAKILWIFSKETRLSAKALDTSNQYFMHVCLL